MYITTISRGKRKEKGKTMRRMTRSHGHDSRPKLSPIDQDQRPALLVGALKKDQPPARLFGEEVLLDSLGSDATGVMFHEHLSKGTLKGRQSILPRGDGTFPTI
jgi:hypothetical protein